MDTYKEKISDLRNVIGMLIKINKDLCNEVENLQEELSREKEKNQSLTDLMKALEENVDKITDKLEDVKNKVNSKTDDVNRSVFKLSESQNAAFDKLIKVTTESDEKKAEQVSSPETLSGGGQPEKKSWEAENHDESDYDDDFA